MTRNVQRELLRNIWLFERCTNKELDAIARIATPIDVAAGRILAKQTELGREFFVVVHGTLEARRDDIVIGTLGPGSFFGEMSLLEDLPRVATVTATVPTTVLVVHAKDFNQLVTSMPSVDRKMLIVLAHRLRELEARFLPDQELIPTSIVAKTFAAD